MNSYKVTPEIEVLSSHFPIPGLGYLPINAFVLKAKEPVLIDTGIGIDSGEFMKALESVIDPKDIRWVWLTHDDSDHTGNIQDVLKAAPNARLVVNSLAAMRMSLGWEVPMQRCYFINPGESISVGDRKLTAVRPPIFDNPTTQGMYDDKSGSFFSSDFCGGIIPSPVEDARDIPEAELARGMTIWATADAPWIHAVDQNKFGQSLNGIRQMAPKAIFSSHLPPAQGKTEQFLKLVEGCPSAEPFVTPNQAAMEAIMAGTGGGS